MASYYEILLLSCIMGLTIFLSLPILSRNLSVKRINLLNSIAVGILIFLIGDVFSDVAKYLYDGNLYGYGSVPSYDLAFFVSMVAAFLILQAYSFRRSNRLTPGRMSLIIALGIGFQNLTEGLVFGSLGSIIGLNGVAAVVLIGFALQNATEGFPIALPLFSLKGKNWTAISLLFLVGGLPTVLGGAIGYYYNSALFDVIFDGVAIGGILFVIIPMLKGIFKEQGPSEANLEYLGILAGFVLGFLVNTI